jgi:4-amino-4-deoxy-L-arabinose transferase-like glycosyltransferase
MISLVPQTSVGRSWAAAAAAIVVYLLGAWSLAGVSGLDRTAVANTAERHELEVRRLPTIDLEGLDALARSAPGVIVTWRGAWEVRSSALYDLALASEGPSSWTIDGVLANAAATFDGGATRRTVWLAAGFHAIEIRHEVDRHRPRIEVLAARLGEPPAALTAAVLKPRPPRNPRLRAVARWLHRGLGAAALVALLIAIRMSVLTWSWNGSRPRRSLDPASLARLGPALAWTALAAILIHGALLRLDAITARYGPVDNKPLVAAVQARSLLPPAAIRPASVAWQPEPLYAHRDGTSTHYRSDPYTYLDAGRNMSSFYGAHFREPVFPFATRIFLALLDGRDVAVSFASAFFSVLAIWLTYVLGAAIWSRPVGLAAALGFSLDYDVITLASAGWRDDAFVVAVVLCAYVMLRWWRVERGSARVHRLGRLTISASSLMAIVAGVAGGFAILTRIMAVSFLAAGVAYFVLAPGTPWRRRLASTSLFAATAILVAAPYFVNCWRVYGDPLYTFNVHGEIYSGAEGQAGWKGSTSSYVREKIARRPYEMVATVAQGMTTYPFENKWFGLERWVPGVRVWASLAALAGLLVLAALPRGRQLLLVFAASLAPFSLTWTIDPDFRFTEHVYPALLIAAALSVSALVRGVRVLLTAGRSGVDPAAERVSWPAWAGTVGGTLVLLWFAWHAGPSGASAEALRARDEITIAAGARDGWAFRSGWSNLMQGANVSMRVTTGEGALSIGLPAAADYSTTIRMDPFPRPIDGGDQSATDVDVVLNGVPVTTIPLRWTAGRVGAYDVVLPAAATRPGENRLVLRVNDSRTPAAPRARRGLTPGRAVALWYVRVRPPAASTRWRLPLDVPLQQLENVARARVVAVDERFERQAPDSRLLLFAHDLGERGDARAVAEVGQGFDRLLRDARRPFVDGDALEKRGDVRAGTVIPE